MSLIEKSAVKNQLSPRRDTGIHLHQPASQPDSTGFSGEESAQPDSEPGLAVREPNKQPALGESGLKPVLVPTVSKSAQA